MTSRKLEQQHQENYAEIMKLYDFAEQLLDTVENEKNLNDAKQQLSLVEPLIEQIEESTEVLAEEYRNFAHTGKKPNILKKKRIETALRNLFLAMKKCSSQLSLSHDVSLKETMTHTLSNIAGSFTHVFNNLRKQLEKVFSLLCHQMQMNFKDYRYSRTGRQEGAARGAENGNNHG